MNFKHDFRNFAVKNQGLSSTIVDKHINNVENMTRSVIEERPTNFREIDVFSRLIADRIIFLGTQVDDHIANILIAQMLFLQSTGDNDIMMYINSPGGSVYAGLGIYDTMQYIGPDVQTICVGLAASMGAVLLAGGAAGKRSALPHSRIMIHQPLGGVQGQSTDIQITANQILQLGNELYDILALHTGQDFDTIKRDCDRDNWKRADAAKQYGLIDEVLYKNDQQRETWLKKNNN